MWFVREGRHGVCMVANSCCVFQTLAATQTMYSCMHFIDNYSIMIMQIVLSARRKKQEEKDNKKAS